MKDAEMMKAKTLSEVAEANRILTGLDSAASKDLAGKGVSSPCYMITSAETGEGKTVAAAGLAMAAARRGGKKVLVVDLNWYRPGLHRCFGFERNWTISECERQGGPEGFVMPSGTEGLDVLTAPREEDQGRGPTAAASSKAADILRAARDGYDLVFVDTASIFPPNRNMLDPVFLGRACDGVFMVVLAGATARQQVKRGRMILESAGVPVFGIVLNNWKNRVC
jgi:Mrp family chromosome partitioning ATPase